LWPLLHTKLGNILVKVATNIMHKIWQHFGEGGNQHYDGGFDHLHTQNLTTFWWRWWRVLISYWIFHNYWVGYF
jgi:hypothetical protein